MVELEPTGPVEGLLCAVGGAGVAEPAQLDRRSIRVAPVDVGEVGPEPQVDAGELGPVGADVVVEAGGEAVPGRLGGAPSSSPSLPGWLARSGGEGRLGLGPMCIEALQHVGEVAARKAPVEGPRRLVVATLESTKAVRQGGQVGEVSRLDDLALDDREDDLDLVQPGGVHGQVHQPRCV